MQKINIINPAAGKNQAIKSIGADHNAHTYVTVTVGDCERFCYETAKIMPETHFTVYGGDGTISEAANGIIRAGTGGVTRLSAKPFGTGNDLLRSFKTPGEYRLDAVKYTTNKSSEPRYFINTVNIGFDANVSDDGKRYKRRKFIPNSAAYTFGIIHNFMKPFGTEMNITYVDLEGVSHTVHDKVLLASVSNGNCCGGGFISSPLSRVDDGIMELIIVKKVSRMKFLSLVSKYKTGEHIDKTTRLPIGEFENIITYVKCRAASVSGMELVALDGETNYIGGINMEIVPNALIFDYN